MKSYALLFEKSPRTNVQISSVYWSIKHSVAIASLHITAAVRRSFMPTFGTFKSCYRRSNLHPSHLPTISAVPFAKGANISEGLVMKTVTGWCLFDCEQLMCFVILHLNWDWKSVKQCLYTCQFTWSGAFGGERSDLIWDRFLEKYWTWLGRAFVWRVFQWQLLRGDRIIKQYLHRNPYVTTQSKIQGASVQSKVNLCS